MSAYELETILSALMIGGSILWGLYELPAWIVRRCER